MIAKMKKGRAQVIEKLLCKKVKATNYSKIIENYEQHIKDNNKDELVKRLLYLKNSLSENYTKVTFTSMEINTELDDKPKLEHKDNVNELPRLEQMYDFV